jgi:hypothetical protein
MNVVKTFTETKPSDWREKIFDLPIEPKVLPVTRDTEYAVSRPKDASFLTNKEFLEKRYCGIGIYSAYNTELGRPVRHIVYCKKRLCDLCSEFWHLKHIARVENRAGYLEATSRSEAQYHFVLTTKYLMSKETAYAAFRYFWQMFRANFGSVEYLATIEQNRKATQPHFHFLACFDRTVDFLSYNDVRSFWTKAQRMAHVSRENIANQIYIKKLDGKNSGYYMLNYLSKSKAGNKSYEIPTKEVWSGRTIRASRGFYPVATAVIDLAVKNTFYFEGVNKLVFGNFELIKSLFGGSRTLCEDFQHILQLVSIAKKDWDIVDDRRRSEPVPLQESFQAILPDWQYCLTLPIDKVGVAV